MSVLRARLAAIGMLAATLSAGCAAPLPSSTSAASTTPAPTVAVGPTAIAPAPSSLPAGSPSPSPAASTAAAKVACYPDDSHWTTATASGSQVPLVITLTCDRAVAAADAAAPRGLSFAYAEFRYGLVCRPGEKCVASLPNVGRVVLHRCVSDGCQSPDLLVRVSSDAAGRVTAADPVPLTKAFVTVACGTPPAAGSPLTCDAAVAAVESLVGPDPGTSSIEFGYGRRLPCPAGFACALTPDNVGWVAFHRIGVLDPRALLWAFSAEADSKGLVAATWVPTTAASPGPS